jgi:polysaccharide export outer membrane protein
MKSPQVTVFVKEYNSQRVTVEGAVKTPGVFPLRGHETLMQVIAKGGGLDRQVASANVVIFRTTDGARTVARYDLDAIRSGGAPDPQVLPGDVVVVDDSMAKQGLQVFLRLTPLATPIAYLF